MSNSPVGGEESQRINDRFATVDRSHALLVREVRDNTELISEIRADISEFRLETMRQINGISECVADVMAVQHRLEQEKRDDSMQRIKRQQMQDKLYGEIVDEFKARKTIKRWVTGVIATIAILAGIVADFHGVIADWIVNQVK